MLGDLETHAKTMSVCVDINTWLFLIGLPHDVFAKRSGNDAFETTKKMVENELGPAVDRVITRGVPERRIHRCCWPTGGQFLNHADAQTACIVRNMCLKFVELRW